jgi:glycosyltransferase involved in cell wall biosynthesis
MTQPRRPRILFAIDSLTGGGAERILAYLANSFAAVGIDVDVVLTLGSDRAYDLDPRIRLRSLLTPRPRRAPTDLGPRRSSVRPAGFFALLVDQSRRLAALLDESPPDCVISFLANTNVICLLAKRVWKAGVPVLCADHTTLSRDIETFPSPSVFRLLVTVLYPAADVHVAVSRGSAKDLHLVFGIPAEEITTIYNGVDLDRIRQDSGASLPAALSDLLRPDGRLKLVSAGRLAPQKAHRDLLSAVAKVSAQCPCDLLLLGEGPLEGELRRTASNFGIEQSVHFLGWQPNPYSIIRAADLFVLSSHWEGLPTVLIEALAVGTPVVSTDCPYGPREILLDGLGGILSPVNDPDALARSILHLAADPVERARLGGVGRSRSDDFKLETMSRRYLDLVEAIAPTIR